MIVNCRHGHIAFYPDSLSDITRLSRNFGVTLVKDGDLFTFPALAGAPRWSLPALTWLGVPAVVAFEGRNSWDVMRENGFVFNVALQRVVPKETVVGSVSIQGTQDYFMVAGGIIQPGMRDDSGAQVLSYHGRLDLNLGTFRLTEFAYE